MYRVHPGIWVPKIYPGFICNLAVSGYPSTRFIPHYHCGTSASIWTMKYYRAKYYILYSLAQFLITRLFDHGSGECYVFLFKLLQARLHPCHVTIWSIIWHFVLVSSYYFDTAFSYCTLILHIDTAFDAAFWYCTLILNFDTAFWYCTLILHFDTALWYWILILHFDTALVYCILILYFETAHWYCILMVQSSSVADTTIWWDKLIQHFDTIFDNAY